jgi:hypothetical protein
MQVVFRKSYSGSNTFHHSARAFRNRLVITDVIIILVAIALVLLQWRMPQAAIIALPKDSAGLNRWAVMLLVMVFGCVGALVTAIPSMASLPRLSSPYNFPFQQSFVKIVLGSLTAVVGVVVIGNTGVATGFASLQSLLGVAIVFGAGQQAVTHILDNRAKEIIGSAPSAQTTDS